MTGTALVPTDDINKKITDLRMEFAATGSPKIREKQCAAMSELHDRLNAGVYEAVIGPVFVAGPAAKRVGVKSKACKEGKKGLKAAREWVAEWHGYTHQQQKTMLAEARYPEVEKRHREQSAGKKFNVNSVCSLLNVIAKKYDQSSPEERTQIREFCQEVQTWL